MKIHVAHILVQHKYEAEDLVKKLKSGQAFETLAQKYSVCPSAKSGGDLGCVEESRLDPDFLETAKVLKIKEVSNPVRTRFGYHLIKKLSDPGS
jgi:parvulin-like peptidyl-prolyl isomerase